MDNLINYLLAHPVILVVVIAAALLFVYLIFREMLKVMLITSLVVIIVGLISFYGYYHGASGDLPQNVRETVERVGDQRERVSGVGKAIIEKSRELAERIREAIQDKRNTSEEK